MLLQDGEIIEIAAGYVVGEAPTIGGDNERGLTLYPIRMRVGRDERGKDCPLIVGEVGGVAGMVRREGGERGRFRRISSTLFRNGEKRIDIPFDAIILEG